MTATSGARIYADAQDDTKWEAITDSDATSNLRRDEKPVEPIIGKGNGEIFVSLPTYRDGQRCAQTLKNLFENAKEPEKVFVGVIEQNDPKDKLCLLEYCASYGVQFGHQRRAMQKLRENHSKCPHFNQIRYLAVYDIAAKAPVFARALARKVLGNEEYCLQIDAHSDFTKDWDVVAKEEWAKTQNEYGVLSTVPYGTEHKSDLEIGGSRHGEVSRQCMMTINPHGVPLYSHPADGKVVDLEKPLLSHAWSAAFSFAKCHLEENAPYDNFAPLAFDAEQFPRFARFWTRGYDVYTPTRNIVYHDYGPNPEGNDARGWPKREEIRIAAVKRIQTLLQLEGGDASQTAQANLGIYGLGTRRTLSQLMDFVGIDLNRHKGRPKGAPCASGEWVPYDASVPTTENLYDNADDLDPQPEYPLRTVTQTLKEAPPPLELAVAERLMSEKGHLAIGHENIGHEIHHDTAERVAPVRTLFTLWLFGLFVWYMVFVNKKWDAKDPVRRKKKTSSHRESLKDV